MVVEPLDLTMFDSLITLENLPPPLLIRVLLNALKSHFTREADKLDEILNGFDQLDQQKLCSMWQGLLEDSSSEQEALQHLTEWIIASLDGGNLTLPHNI